MREKIQVIAVIIVIVILAGGAGYYIYSDFVKHRVSDMPDNSGAGVEGTGDFKVEQIPIEDNVSAPIPDLARAINISADLPEDARKIARENIEKLIVELKQNPNSFDSWLELAIYRKMISDYEGAKEIWGYTSKMAPNDAISFNNLGDLYAYYLKDSAKAEENFLKALENGPDQVYVYRNVHDFYLNVMKDEAKAKKILEDGIKANPGASQDLQNLLKSY
ncbi:hypothetical protein KKA18_02085 [Patescibacteria group bacterium]|nr:hypothetical protein [Patescibacteria group bacterium]